MRRASIKITLNVKNVINDRRSRDRYVNEIIESVNYTVNSDDEIDEWSHSFDEYVFIINDVDFDRSGRVLGRFTDAIIATVKDIESIDASIYEYEPGEF
jgi:uncharacterized protein YutD